MFNLNFNTVNRRLIMIDHLGPHHMSADEGRISEIEQAFEVV